MQRRKTRKIDHDAKPRLSRRSEHVPKTHWEDGQVNTTLRTRKEMDKPTTTSAFRQVRQENNLTPPQLALHSLCHLIRHGTLNDLTSTHDLAQNKKAASKNNQT
ncbi:hypothetical protein D6783_02210 [Candidatus Woesearchaeota archaeon]|nr:MAG: hypothetical protein D6783_02210 [Candidatus Woesearchaeota archaeon]